MGYFECKSPLASTDIDKIPGPILVLGAGGFIGERLVKRLRSERDDVFGTFHANLSQAKNAFGRFIPGNISCDLLTGARAVIEQVRPRTIFDMVAYGGYLAQKDVARIYQTNVALKAQLLELAAEYKIGYIHAGSSSEYGDILNAPREDIALKPYTHYAVAKGAAAGLIHYFGRHRGLRCANLRLYAVYGPGEPVQDRFIPQLILQGLKREYPPFVPAMVTRDFIYVEDVCDAFIQAAIRLDPEYYGHSFNIGTGEATSIGAMAHLAKVMFNIPREPVFGEPAREYDLKGKWCANTEKVKDVLGWRATTSLYDGLRETIRWYQCQK